MNKVNNAKKAFTLVEILVVIAIIGILTTIIIAVLNNAQAYARDAVRKNDVASYARVLLMDQAVGLGEFPKEGSLCCLDADPSSPLYCSAVRSSAQIVATLQAIPKDPQIDGTMNHCYRYISNGESATITVPLENGEIYKYVLGSHAITQTGTSTINLISNNNPLSISGNWSREGTGADISILRKKENEAPTQKDDTEAEEIEIAGQENFTDSEIENDKKYCYSVWNYNSGDQLYSLPFSACAYASPAALSSFSANTINSSSIDLSWIKTKSEYRTIVRRSNAANPETVSDGDSVVVSNIEDLTKTDSSLTPGTTYFYSVFSHNETTNLDSLPISKSAKTAPSSSNISLSATSSSIINISFSVPQGATGVYIRYRQGQPAPSSRTDGSLVGIQSGSSYNQTGLTGGTEYCYSVWAYDEINSLYSDSPASACTTTLNPVPAMPSLSVVASSQTGISLTYNIPQYATKTEITRVSPSYTWTQTTETSLVDSGLALSTQYCYFARSWNTSGYSDSTSSQCATTLSNIPQPPSSLTCTGTSTTVINCSWPSVSGADTYELQRDATTIQNTSSTSKSDTTTCGSHTYRVRSCSATYGCSTTWTTSNSSTVVIAAPSTPTNFRASDGLQCYQELTWDIPPSAVKYRYGYNEGAGGIFWTYDGPAKGNQVFYSYNFINGNIGFSVSRNWYIYAFNECGESARAYDWGSVSQRSGSYNPSTQPYYCAPEVYGR